MLDTASERLPGGAPIGWLAQVRMLRNRSTHHSTLARHFDVAIGSQAPRVFGLTLDGAQAPVDPSLWLSGRLDDVVTLCAALVADAASTDRLRPS